VNSASIRRAFRPGFRGVGANQPDSTFPQSPGIILETPNVNLLITATHLSSFNEL
jgi:hypothetical protein